MFNVGFLAGRETTVCSICSPDLSTDGRNDRSGNANMPFLVIPALFASHYPIGSLKSSFEEGRWNGPSDGADIVSYAYIVVQDREWSRFTLFLFKLVYGDMISPTVLHQGDVPSHRTVTVLQSRT